MKEKTYTHLSYEERFVIETLLKKETPIREIARFLERSPNTISNEIAKNAVHGAYTAKKAHHKAYVKRWRSKRACLKVVMDEALHRFVDKKLRAYWSPEQISGHLKEQLGIICSKKAIYTFARKRCYDRYLFWGWNKKKSCPKSGWKYKKQDDGRKYIEKRMQLQGLGHYEIDFIVSKASTWVLLVVVDRLSKKTWVERLPNRKRATVLGALSGIFHGIPVESITTDNDIAFACWRDIEHLFTTQVYFTHPYHSWEKGLVENMNRWIRCFVPKKQDIGTVSEKDLWSVLAFLNDRPKQSLGFLSPRVYHYIISQQL